MSRNDTEKDYKPVQSIERVFQVLETLAENPEGLSLMSLADKTGLPSSTVHRLLHTLYALGYTEWRYSNSAPYKLTMRLFEYGSASVENRPFVRAARPFLDRLAEEVNLSTHIFFPDHFDTICALQSTRSSFSNAPPLGMRIPMWCSSAGRCILASYSKEKIQEVWGARGATLYGPNAPDSLEQLLTDIVYVQQNKYFFSNEGFRVGLSCLSVPLVDQSGSTIGALGVCGAPPQFPPERVPHLAGHLRQFSESLISTQSHRT